MNVKLKTKWIAALRSGEYNQTQYALKREKDDGELSYCCLGVLCELSSIPNKKGNLVSSYQFAFGEHLSNTMPVGYFLDSIGITGHEAGTLASMNDNMGKSFIEIADWIEENL